MIFTRWIPGCCLAASLWAPPAVADDCGRVADAYAKGAREKRTALSDVEDTKRGATTPPLRIWTEKAEYVSDMRGGYQKLRPGPNGMQSVADAIRAGARTGKVKCRVVGPDLFRSAKITKIHFNDPTANASVAEQTAWIDDATGRLVYLVLDGSESGFGWTYGAEVKDPPS